MRLHPALPVHPTRTSGAAARILGTLLVLGLVLSLPAAAGPQPEVEGREYKLMLDPNQFLGSGSTLQTRVNTYWSAVKTVVQSAPLGRTASGSLAYEQQRSVMFYDVPGSCELNQGGYILRERVGSTGARELTLKFRSADRYIAGARNVAGNQADAETKFEDDITAPFKAVFSHSTKQTISAGKNINELQDIVDLYPGFASQGDNTALPLTRVGGLTVYEKTWKGGKADLGSKTGDFTLTLWYTTSGGTTPVLAEVSYAYGDADEQYTGTVAGNGKLLLEQMQAMAGWALPSGLTKTAWVYAYQPGYCY